MPLSAVSEPRGCASEPTSIRDDFIPYSPPSNEDERDEETAKCDSYLNPNEPCSRCRRVGADCIISDPFKREHKRKRLSELQHEAEELRKQLGSDRGNHGLASPIAVLTAAAEMSRTPESLNAYTPAISPPQSGIRVAAPQIIPSNIRPPPVIAREMPMVHSDGETQPRTLNNTVRIEGSEIDDIFEIFFRDYAPLMPILDPATTPNSYYAQSPLLFWVILLVASRSYNKNPTLFIGLKQPVNDMLLLSLSTNATPVPKIQSLILYLTWPVPNMEVLFPFSGLLLHLAMQNGLHMPMASHEFSRQIAIPKENPLQADRNVDMQRRSELWAQCIVVYQRTCLQKGQPPRAMLDLVPESGQKLCQRLSPALTTQLKCLEIVSRCCISIFVLGVRNTSPEHERSLGVIIRTYENQLKDFQESLPPDANTLYLTIAQLQIQVFHLYKDLSGPHDGCFTKLARTACSVIEHVKVLFDKPETYPSCPIFIVNALVIACSSLLRLMKSVVARDLDFEQAKSSFFTGINLLNGIAIDPTDFPAKCSQAFNQLWNSPKAFRKADGTEHTTLRIRSRLVMAPPIDVIWWWREDKGSEQGQALKEEKKTAAAEDIESPVPDSFNMGSEFQFLDDEFLADFEWAVSSDYLLPSEPYSDIAWPMPNPMLPPT